MAVAIDFETYYSSDYSVKDLGTYLYVKHEELDPYAVSVVTSGGQEFVGNPRDFDWNSIAGMQWVSHNKGFDWAVYQEGLLRGWWKGPNDPENWHCSFDLCVYLGVPSALDKATKFLYGHELKKTVRTKMSGRRWRDLSEEKQQALEEYALEDSRWCLKIWDTYQHLWPDDERWLSEHTRRMSWRGVPVSAERIDEGIQTLSGVLHEAERKIPWAGDPNKKLQSLAHFASFCRSIGVEPPSSTAEKNNPAGDKWIADLGEDHEAVEVLYAMRRHRQSNHIYKKLIAFKSRIKEDGVFMAYGLKYGGAHTLRDAGAEGINLQNLPRKAQFNIDLRSMIVAPPGFKFISSDLDQIEPRVSAWIVQDSQKLDLLREGYDPYEAYARSSMGYTDARPLAEVDPDLRWLCKQAELSLCYGVGWRKLQATAANEGHELSVDYAKSLVNNYRSANRETVCAQWRRLEEAMKRSNRDNFEVVLPSKRRIHYWHVESRYDAEQSKRILKAALPKYASMQEAYLYGGKLYENLIQAIARDVFMHCVRLIEQVHNIPVVLRVHDEVLCLAREEEAEAVKQVVHKCMNTPPAWAASLPVAASAEIIDVYTK